MMKYAKVTLQLYCNDFRSRQIIYTSKKIYKRIEYLYEIFIFASGVFGMPARSCKDFIDQ